MRALLPPLRLQVSDGSRRPSSIRSCFRSYSTTSGSNEIDNDNDNLAAIEISSKCKTGSRSVTSERAISYRCAEWKYLDFFFKSQKMTHKTITYWLTVQK